MHPLHEVRPPLSYREAFAAIWKSNLLCTSPLHTPQDVKSVVTEASQAKRAVVAVAPGVTANPKAFVSSLVLPLLIPSTAQADVLLSGNVAVRHPPRQRSMDREASSKTGVPVKLATADERRPSRRSQATTEASKVSIKDGRRRLSPSCYSNATSVIRKDHTVPHRTGAVPQPSQPQPSLSAAKSHRRTVTTTASNSVRNSPAAPTGTPLGTAPCGLHPLRTPKSSAVAAVLQDNDTLSKSSISEYGAPASSRSAGTTYLLVNLRRNLCTGVPPGSRRRVAAAYARSPPTYSPPQRQHSSTLSDFTQLATKNNTPDNNSVSVKSITGATTGSTSRAKSEKALESPRSSQTSQRRSGLQKGHGKRTVTITGGRGGRIAHTVDGQRAGAKSSVGSTSKRSTSSNEYYYPHESLNSLLRWKMIVGGDSGESMDAHNARNRNPRVPPLPLNRVVKPHSAKVLCMVTTPWLEELLRTCCSASYAASDLDGTGSGSEAAHTQWVTLQNRLIFDIKNIKSLNGIEKFHQSQPVPQQCGLARLKGVRPLYNNEYHTVAAVRFESLTVEVEADDVGHCQPPVGRAANGVPTAAGKDLRNGQEGHRVVCSLLCSSMGIPIGAKYSTRRLPVAPMSKEQLSGSKL
eukprot:Lankesteria_metandrocarpae@DN10321_c0_g1_i2.p1